MAAQKTSAFASAETGQLPASPLVVVFFLESVDDISFALIFTFVEVTEAVVLPVAIPLTELFFLEVEIAHVVVG